MRPTLGAAAGVSAPAVSGATLALVLGVLSARFLGAVGQGRYTVVVTTVSLVSLVFALGIGPALRLSARPQPSPGQLGSYASATIALGLVTGLTSAVVIAATSDALAALRPAGAILVTLYGTVFMIGQRAAEILQAYGLTRESLGSLVVTGLVQLLWFGGLILLDAVTVGTAVAGAMAGSLAQGLWCLSLIKRRFGLWHPLLGRGQIGQLVRLGSPSLGMYVGLAMIQRIDRLLLSSIVGAQATGVYALSASLAEAARLVPSAVGQLVFTLTAQAGRVTNEGRRLYRVGIAVLGLTAAGGMLAAPLIPVLAGDQYAPSVRLFRVLVLAECVMGVAMMDSRMVMGLGRLRAVGGAGAVLITLSVPTYTLMIHAWGAEGAAWGSLLLYGLYAGIMILFRARFRAGTDDVDEPPRREEPA